TDCAEDPPADGDSDQDCDDDRDGVVLGDGKHVDVLELSEALAPLAAPEEPGGTEADQISESDEDQGFGEQRKGETLAGCVGPADGGDSLHPLDEVGEPRLAAQPVPLE